MRSTESTLEDILPSPRRAGNLLPAKFQLSPIRIRLKARRSTKEKVIAGTFSENSSESRCLRLAASVMRKNRVVITIIEIGSDDRKLTFQVIVRDRRLYYDERFP